MNSHQYLYHPLAKYVAVTLVALFIAMASVFITTYPFYLFLIILVGSGWGLYGAHHLFHQFKTQPFHKIKESDLPTQTLLNNIKQQCRSIFRYLNQHPIGSFFKTKTRCWIFLIGANETGKTHLLANTGMKLQSPFQASLTDIEATQTLGCWVNDDHVFVDLGGHYATPNTDPLHQPIWPYLLSLCARYKKRPPIDHLLLVVDFPSLIQKNHEPLNLLMKQLSQQVNLAKHFQKDLPISIIITQCDKMSGFKEFFEHFGSEELIQPMGIRFHSTSQDSALSEIFKKHYKELVQRISEQLILRLHHERNLDKRNLLKDFPIHIEKIQNTLEHCLKQLPWDFNTPLCGIYFTSTLQQDSVINLFEHSPYRIDKEKKEEFLRRANQKTFFTQVLLQHFIRASDQLNHLIDDVPPTKIKLVVYLLAAIGIFTMTGVWYLSYQNNMAGINSVKTILNEASFSESTSWLNRLAILTTMIQTLDQKHVQYYQWTGLSQAAELRNQAIAAYQNIIHTSFKEYIDQLMQLELQQLTQEADKAKLFSTLKIYSMLAHKDQFNETMVKDWFTHYFEKQYANAPEEQQKLQHYLEDLLKSDVILNPNNSALQQAQATLKTMPLSELALIELKSNFIGSTPLSQLNNFKDISGLALDKIEIPDFYLPQNFSSITQNGIPSIQKTLQDNAWIVPVDFQSSPNILKQIQTDYEQQYAKTWLSIVMKIQLTPANNLAAVNASVQLLTHNESPLFRFLNLVIEQVNATHVDSSFIENDPNYLSIRLLTDHNEKNKNFYSALENFSKYLKDIDTSPNKMKSAYNAVIHRLSNNKKEDPLKTLSVLEEQSAPPVQSWIHTMRENASTVLLDLSRQYLNTIWQSTVYPEYSAIIENRYPLFSDSQNDISLKDFTHFFGPDGTINAFFEFYLKPFVNHENNYWEWKKIDGENLGISQDVLDMFLRASMIQKMFFTNDPNTPSITFKLSPANLSDNNLEFSLSMGGQKIPFDTRDKNLDLLNWPGPNPNMASMQFSNGGRLIAQENYEGQWSWFRLLSHAKIEPMNNTKQYKITFTLENNLQASYQLTTNNLINPFIPGILNAFRCPGTL